MLMGLLTLPCISWYMVAVCLTKPWDGIPNIQLWCQPEDNTLWSWGASIWNMVCGLKLWQFYGTDASMAWMYEFGN